MKAMKKILALLCVVLMLFSMSGCRDSSVLEKIIYDYLRAHQTDMEKDVYSDVEDEEIDDVLLDLEKNDESDRENEAEEVDPVYNPNQEPTQSETAGIPNYSENSSGSDTAAVNPIPDSEGGISGAESDEVSDELSNGSQQSTSDDQTVETGSDTVSDDVGDVGVNGGNTSTRFVVDSYGNSYEVPENVNSVAAVGNAALAVLMLGGVDMLAAADESLTSDALAAKVFSGLSSVPALWTGSGESEALSDAALQQLIEIHPDVCFEVSGSATFTTEQVEILEENGIYYVPLPAPSSAANLKLMVELVGKVLGDHTAEGGYDCVSRCEEYCTWVDQTLSSVSSAGGSSAYTLYVDGWDENAYYYLPQVSGCYGYGVALINNGQMESCKAVSAFLSLASVTNVTSLGTFFKTETLYFTPIDRNKSTVTVTGTAATSCTMLKLITYGGALGVSNFQVVIAASQSVKAGIESNYLWQTYDYIKSGNGSFWDYGFLDDTGNVVPNTIHGDYEVIVNPRGIGAWASGSVESVLESVWASYAIAGGYSEEDMRATVKDFYQTFYNYSLSDTELNAILAGEA